MYLWIPAFAFVFCIWIAPPKNLRLEPHPPRARSARHARKSLVFFGHRQRKPVRNRPCLLSGGLERILPELLAINNQSAIKPRVTFYEGLQGIEDVYADMLRDKKEICAYEDLDNIKKGTPERLFNYFPKERAKRDILIRSISRDTPFAREFSKGNRGLLRETKFISVGEFRTDINIYGNKIALMDLRGEPKTCVLIENENLAETFRIIWKQFWSVLGPAVE